MKEISRRWSFFALQGILYTNQIKKEKTKWKISITTLKEERQSKLDAEDIIGKIPDNAKCIWLRDEGHIKTNRYDELLKNVCYKVVNFSATNPHSDIQCKEEDAYLVTGNIKHFPQEPFVVTPKEMMDIILDVNG